MSQTLNLKNFSELNVVEQTQLNADVPAASNSLPVADAQGFTSGYLLIGTPSSKIAELLPNTSVNTGQTIALTSNTVLQHKQYEQVTALFGNKLRIYRAPNVDGTQPADSVFTANLLATIDIDPNDDATAYTDAGGGSGYWYKYTFFNLGSGGETDIASSSAVRGNISTNYCSLDEIREEAGFKYAVYVSDNKLDIARQAAQDEINGALNEFYVVPLVPPINDWVKRITIRMAAGYARQGQYSQISDGKINGDDMVKGAQADLKKLIMKERELMTKDGKSLAGSGAAGGADGWPNNSTATTPPSSGGAPRVFRMSDIQGQPMTDSNGIPRGNLYYGRKW